MSVFILGIWYDIGHPLTSPPLFFSFFSFFFFLSEDEEGPNLKKVNISHYNDNPGRRRKEAKEVKEGGGDLVEGLDSRGFPPFAIAFAFSTPSPPSSRSSFTLFFCHFLSPWTR